MGRADRKLDAPEETLNLNAHVIDQELRDEKVGGGLTDAMVGQKPPVLSCLPAGSRKIVEVSVNRPPIRGISALDGGLRCVARAIQKKIVTVGQQTERVGRTCRWK